MNSSHVKYFRGARKYEDILGMRAITEVGNHFARSTNSITFQVVANPSSIRNSFTKFLRKYN